MEGLTDAERQEALAQQDEWFPDGGYYRSSDHVLVTDAYTLTNRSDADQTVTVLYPFASSLDQLGEDMPDLTLDGAEVETSLRIGAYSGGFEGAWDGTLGGDPEGSVNLDYANSWEDYQALLADGSYLERAMGPLPDLSGVPAIVYRFTDPWGEPEDDDAGIPNPTIRVTFSLDYDKTRVLTTGFHAGMYDRENGIMGKGFSIPQPGELRPRRSGASLSWGRTFPTLPHRAMSPAAGTRRRPSTPAWPWSATRRTCPPPCAPSTWMSAGRSWKGSPA